MTGSERKDRRLRRTGLTLALALAALSLVAAGCGGASKDAGTAAPGSDDPALEWARCMRKHGAEVPDPRTDENGRLVITGEDRDDRRRDRAYGRALTACRDLFERARPAGVGEVSAEERERFFDRALRFVRCLREHGVDISDPVVRERELAIPLPANPDSPSFRRAHRACERLLPPGA